MSDDSKLISNDLIKEVEKLYLEGKFQNADEIAIALGVAVDIVKKILEILNVSTVNTKKHVLNNEEEVVALPSSENDRILYLQKYHKMMDELIDIANWEYSSSPDEKAASVINSFVGTASNLIQQLEKYDNKQKIAEELLIKVLNPFSEAILKLFIDELKDKILAELPVYLKEEQMEEMNASVNLCLTRIGSRFSEELDITRLRVADLMGVPLLEKAKKSNHE